MKKVYALVIVVLMLICLTACGNQNARKTPKHHEVVSEAVEQVKCYWKQLYLEDEMDMDGYFEIKNTRIITIKDNDIELFSDVAYLVEFELFTDYFGSSPYYENCGAYDTVVVYKNGEMAVANSLIREYRARTYETDVSSFVESIDDYQNYYNCVEKLK